MFLHLSVGSKEDGVRKPPSPPKAEQWVHILLERIFVEIFYNYFEVGLS